LITDKAANEPPEGSGSFGPGDLPLVRLVLDADDFARRAAEGADEYVKELDEAVKKRDEAARKGLPQAEFDKAEFDKLRHQASEAAESARDAAELTQRAAEKFLEGSPFPKLYAENAVRGAYEAGEESDTAKARHDEAMRILNG